MKKHHVLILDGSNIKKALERAFGLYITGDLRGKKVLVKPNMFRSAIPEDGVVTAPVLISETVTYLLSHSADVMVGDNSVPNRTCSEMEIARVCGYLKAAQGFFRNIGRYSKKIKFGQRSLKEIYVSREVLDCDLLVSLPKFRTHDLTMMSMAVKNSFGIIPGGLKPYIHSLFPKIQDFSRILIEVYNIRPPDIILVDCLTACDARKKHFTPNIIIAGDNGHAVDWVGAKVAGINPISITTLKAAYEEGLFDPETVEIEGKFEPLKGYALPLRFPFRSSVVAFGAQVLYQIWLRRVPVLDMRSCSYCRSCEYVCPTRAIRRQVIDYQRCIKCYCCLEVCPENAIKTRLKL